MVGEIATVLYPETVGDLEMELDTEIYMVSITETESVTESEAQ